MDTYFLLVKLRSFAEVFKRYLKPVFNWPSCSVCTVAYKGTVGYRVVLLKNFVSHFTHLLPFRFIIRYRYTVAVTDYLPFIYFQSIIGTLFHRE